jgi:hypothetical protein
MRSVDAPAGPQGASADLFLARYAGLDDQPMPIGEELAGYQQGVFGVRMSVQLGESILPSTALRTHCRQVRRVVDTRCRLLEPD